MHLSPGIFLLIFSTMSDVAFCQCWWSFYFICKASSYSSKYTLLVRFPYKRRVLSATYGKILLFGNWNWNWKILVFIRPKEVLCMQATWDLLSFFSIKTVNIAHKFHISIWNRKYKCLWVMCSSSYVF